MSVFDISEVRVYKQLLLNGGMPRIEFKKQGVIVNSETKEVTEDRT
jgi:hypothetical protein